MVFKKAFKVVTELVDIGFSWSIYPGATTPTMLIMNVWHVCEQCEISQEQHKVKRDKIP